MEGFASPLVQTKLRVPAGRARSIPRARLINLLVGANGAGLTLVCAPAGYGKTTLLIEWAHSARKRGTAVAWYALDPSDDDPVPFGSYLIASLIEALGPLPGLAQLAQSLRAAPEPDLQRILPTLINTVVAAEQDCLLILDDYHLIGVPAVHSAIAYLLEHLPENMRLAIGSRADPPLPLARMRARGQLLEVRTASLRFTADETALFLNHVMQLDLPTEGVAALDERSEGWVAGLQLAALAMRTPLAPLDRTDQRCVSARQDFIAAFRGDHRYLVEYLLEEVFRNLPAEVQSFLLTTAILERLCAPLCAALRSAGSSGSVLQSEAILQHLEQANLFLVALDEQGEWFRYHHLFRDFLRARLHKTLPDTEPELQRAACEWLAEHGLLREASAHAFQTQDWDYAAAFVEQHGFTMLIHSEIAVIYEWCAAFPEDVLRARPNLGILQCWPLVLHFRRQNRETVEARLQQAEQAASAIEDREMAGQLLEHAAIVRAFLTMAPDPHANARAHLANAQKLLEEHLAGDASQFSALLAVGYALLALHQAQAAEDALQKARQIALRERLYFGVVEATFHMARLAHSQGRLRHAAQICQQGKADLAALLAEPERELPGLGSLDIALGCVLLEQDRLVEAEQLLLHGLELVGWRMNPYYLMTGSLAIFHLYQVQGRAAEAEAVLDRLEAAWPDIAFCTRGLRILHRLRAAPHDPHLLGEATAWCQSFSPDQGEDLHVPGVGPFGAAEVYSFAYQVLARAQIAAGNGQTARVYLTRQRELAEANGLKDRVIQMALLEAQLEAGLADRHRTEDGQSEDRQQLAFRALERAMELAQPEGYLLSFDQGPLLARLLREAASREIFPGYVAQIMAAIDNRQAPPAAQPIAVDTTTPPRKSALGESALDKAAPDKGGLDQAALAEPLSERELEVLRLIARGASNQAIAESLVITVGTVKSHVNHILGKLGVQNRTQAAARAREIGYLDF